MPLRSFQHCAGVMALGLSACVQAPIPLQQSVVESRTQQLASAIADSDRLEIATVDDAGNRQLITRSVGFTRLNELKEILKFDEGYGFTHRDTPAAHVFTFYAGDEEKVVLSLRDIAYFLWDNGLWESDVILDLMSRSAFLSWSAQVGIDVIHPPGTNPYQAGIDLESDMQAFVAHFNPAAQKVFRLTDAAGVQGDTPRVISTPLASCYDDQTALIQACLAALGGTAQPWTHDDWKIGAVQGALRDISAKAILAAASDSQPNPNTILGTARYFFRFELYEGLDPDERDDWAVRLTAAVLDSNQHGNKHTALRCLSQVPGEPVSQFLRDVARGRRVYLFDSTWSTSMQEEPSLPSAAAMLLAQRGDTGAASILNKLDRPNANSYDRASIEIGRALLDPEQPLKPAHFKYRSDVLSRAAISALRAKPRELVTADVLSAAIFSQDNMASKIARRMALEFRLERTTKGLDSVSDDDVHFNLLEVRDNPEGARQHFEEIKDRVGGVSRVMLLNQLADLQRQSGDHDAAEETYRELLGMDDSLVNKATFRKKLAWLYWSEGKVGPAQQIIEEALSEQPEADLLLLRGITKYALGEFDLSTEYDFAGALALDPNNAYAALMLYLATSLQGRAGGDDLHAYEKKEPPPSDGNVVIGLGQLLGLTATNPTPTEWPMKLVEYMRGNMSAEQLLEEARNGPFTAVPLLECEAHFYISQKARIEGDTVAERNALKACISTDQRSVAEFGIARIRLLNLDPANGAESRNQAETLINAGAAR